MQYNRKYKSPTDCGKVGKQNKKYCFANVFTGFWGFFFVITVKFTFTLISLQVTVTAGLSTIKLLHTQQQ